MRYHYIITPDGQRRFLADAAEEYITGEAADYLLDQIEHGERSNEAEKQARKEIAEEDAALQALMAKGIKI